MIKKFLLLVLSFIFGGVIFSWIIQTVGWEEIQSIFSAIHVWQIATLFLIYLLVPILEGYRWKEILKTQKKKISFKDSSQLGIIAFAINFLFPALFGLTEFFRGYFLKRKKDYLVTKISSSIVIDRIVGWTVNIIIIVVSVFLFFYQTNAIPHDLLINISWFFGFFTICLAVFYFKVFNKSSIVRIFYRFLNSDMRVASQEIEKDVFGFFNLPGRKMIKPFLISAVKDLIMVITIWLLMFFLEIKISFLAALFILGFTYLIVVIPLPASLGTHEAIQIFVFSSLGLKSSSAVAFAMLLRGAGVLISLLGFVLFFRIGGSFLKKYFYDTD